MPPTNLLDRRLALCRRKRLCIISPHLDDAGFSTLAALQSPVFEHRRVVTVVTEAGRATGSDWARSAGFSHPAAEFEARRAEDRQALGGIGVDVEHLGVATGGSQELIDGSIRGFLEGEVSRLDGTLYLLPGGAGGADLRRGPSRLVNRILRRPAGAVAHPEHLAVRNALAAGLRDRADACFGFYAEQPYLWNDSAPRLCRELEQLSGIRLETIRVQTQTDRKLRVARQYASQFPLIFGASAGFQRRALARAEEYFLAASRASSASLPVIGQVRPEQVREF